ncbi:MAG TPA: HDOD domain-containing protein [Noviherbaspirillum sp.]|uniref:HDOD domain-containing protein n=1 Tax=Noviherbaspirillum sp. TaxID=1926288 RepID=UPI002D47CCDB|nr:HDOD domain-containing protein [Noviherbaspirillum sp.]HYD96343.1 HDOD domain-containing protein [Noviherbaspirillum sp.]
MVLQNTGTARPEVDFWDGNDKPNSARDSLLQKIGAAADLPALGSSVSRVVQMTSSNDEAVRNLAHFILSDVALTQKILRISNTVTYRTAAGTPVTTISKAIFLLGFDTVKTAALAMLLVDRMSSRNAKSVRNELSHALCASIVGREIARRSHFKDAEEAAVASLFKNIGRLLVAAYDHTLYDDVAKLVDAGTHTPVQASMQVLGCTFEALAEAVLREWNIPDSIVQALNPPPPGVLKPAKGRQEWLQQVAAFSSAAARLIPNMNAPGQEAANRAVLTRFGAALGLDQAKLSHLFAGVAQETRVLASNAELALQADEHEHAAQETAAPDATAGVAAGQAGPAAAAPAAASAAQKPDLESGLPTELLLDLVEEALPLQIYERHASGKPMNARDLLLAGVQDVTQMMASGRCKVNDLMLLVLETLYNSLGFRFATVCLKDIHAHQYRARIAMGENNEERQAGFVFPIATARDLFHLALENDADLMISDATVPKIRDLLPGWHRTLLPDARSFIVLPLVVQKKQLGLFYADRVSAAPEGVPPDETALIKTLKGQVLTALNAR